MTNTPTAIRILSSNIQAGSRTRAYREYVTRSWSHVLPNGKRANLDDLARLTSQFDIVGLQESDPGSLRSGFDNQGNVLAELAKFPFHSHQANRRIGRIAGSGNALLSRLEPSEMLDYVLPGRLAGRGVLIATFGSGKQSWQLAITHLSLGVKSRQLQCNFLADLFGDCRRLVLMGDFNCEADAPEMQVLYRRTRLQAPPQRIATFPSWAPTRSLDHILCAGFDMCDYEAVVAAGSDHLAIAASIKDRL
ncbi:MAG TPA: endonuclease/exonuclease/phosphatase family protein [Arenimonas sp.]|nr:endonuclease/exonuclease/phosphatase family protein [Arenimonas sp.]HOZ05834.1 endonuclease/exonuclease/phosphatase family protein [Arenimonas sp.]